MFLGRVILFLFYTISVFADDVTFNNVEFHGYSVFTLKFTRKISRSNTLKDHVPKEYFDHLEFLNQYIPVLRTGSVTDLSSLDELTIEECNLTAIEPGAFQNVPNLRKLNLKNNVLVNIEDGVFNGLTLSTLDLGKNQIKTIGSNGLDDLPNLLNINLADNNIAEWDKNWFKKTPMLTRISMQNNSLKTLPKDAFTNLIGTKSYGKVKLTINLIFSYNRINTIDRNAFRGLKNINNLWLDNNKLTDLNGKLLDGVEVDNLRIGHNLITCFKDDLDGIIKAEITHLDNNPYDCDCLEKIKIWAKKNDKSVDIFHSDMDCRIKRMRGKIDGLKDLLGKTNTDKSKEETTLRNLVNVEDEVEVLFK